uniref:CACN subunit beta associated regulatory protein n=1 Tax=Prolemur simus TaxID=1328070 RepID=A0A8C9DI14_PROSS
MRGVSPPPGGPFPGRLGTCSFPRCLDQTSRDTLVEKQAPGLRANPKLTPCKMDRPHFKALISWVLVESQGSQRRGGWPERRRGARRGSDSHGLAYRLEAAEAAGGASPESPLERGGVVGPEHQQQQQQPDPELDAERDSGPEQAQTSYRDLWSLRASLELHAAASDHSSSGNDRDSVRSGDSSGSGGAAPTFPPPSPPASRPKDGEARRLLQMDSGYASIEGRGAGDDTELPAVPTRPRSPRAWPRRPRRDYSIDEKTDALFHEFLRHDPHFDDAPPSAARHRARAHPHPRKQWQRGRQHSDPGMRAAPPLAGAPTSAAARPARAPLRRGDSVDGPPDGRALGSTGDDPAIPVIEEEPGGGCPGSGLCVEPPGALLDKLAAGLEERLFPLRLAEPVVAAAPALVAAAPTSPDHSPA